MTDNKKWYLSKTIIASFISLISIILSHFNIIFEPDTLTDNIVSIIAAVSSMVAMYGRVVAKTTIKM